jgi:branched-chain amino acid transport system ATP-binding protein
MDPLPERDRGLSVVSVSVRFGGIAALEGVDLVVDPGEIVGLVGPNGAGKTTLINCVGGQLVQSSGSVWLGGECLDGLPPFRRARRGVARTFQRIAVFPELTIREHLFIAVRARRRGGARWSELVDRGRPDPDESAEIATTLELVGLADRADAAVSTLPLGACRLVELGRALIGRPTVVLADEPSSGLDARERATLATVLRTLPEQGIGVLLVEHDLPMVSLVCDRVVVLHVGRVIAQGPFQAVMADPAVRRAYLGQVA